MEGVPSMKAELSSYTPVHCNSTASFNLTRLPPCGDINPNPGPNTSENTKLKCKPCERTTARNHRTVQCLECQLPYHLKCSGLSMKNFQQVQSNTGFSWICNLCLLATLPVDLSFTSDFSETNILDQHGEYANESVPEPWIIQERKRNANDLFTLYVTS